MGLGVLIFMSVMAFGFKMGTWFPEYKEYFTDSLLMIYLFAGAGLAYVGYVIGLAIGEFKHTNRFD